MRQRLLRSVGWITACLLLLTTTGAVAGEGRDFAGSYQLDQAVELGEQVQVTLSFRVINYSGASLNAATIKLKERALAESVCGTFTVGPLGDRGSTKLTGTFTVPRYEYEYWQQGGVPYLSIEFTNAAGNPVYQVIELAPSFGGEV